MPVKTLDAATVVKMFIGGAKNLDKHKDLINELNVFPVPDGDTGTNMTLTIMSAAQALQALEEPDIKQFSKAVASGSLRGARGNSGVLLSQLLRGFTRGIEDKDELTTDVLAQAMQKAVETAYKAVMKPKEGTILTVANSMASKAGEICSSVTDIEEFINAVIEEGDRSLDNTPELLPVLKEAGVVDSGGKGLMTVMHGAFDVFTGKETDLTIEEVRPAAQAAPRKHIETDDIKFGYCTEFIILLEKKFTSKDEKEMKKFLTSIGDSLVVVADTDIVKIHVHTNDPGLAIQRGLKFGQLTSMKIDNMREEHKETLFGAAEEPVNTKEDGFLAVCAGSGLVNIFRELGTDEVVEGGQTMNPSADDLLQAVSHIPAENVFIMPNNKNIILTANQAKDLCKDKNIYVIPTKTIPQGIAAMVNYIKDDDPADNAENMTEGLKYVKSAEFTYAVRTTSIDDHEIHEGDFMGIGDSGLIACGPDLDEVIIGTLDEMVDEDSELISIYRGKDMDEEHAEALADMISERYEDAEVEVNYGGQPVYNCLISVE